MSEPSADPSLLAMLARLDACLVGRGRASRMLRKGVKNTQLSWLGRELGARLPQSLRALLSWHDGERKALVFDRLLRADLEAMWGSWSENAFEARLLPLASIARLGATEATLDENGHVGRIWNPTVPANRKLVPFVRVRDLGPDGHTEDDVPLGQDDSDADDQDWLLAVDDIEERVWLFEIGNQGLEGLHTPPVRTMPGCVRCRCTLPRSP
jgi:hypothetical protein